MRVVHVHRIRGIGGSERHLLTLLPALAERGAEPLFVGLDDPAWDPADFYGALRVPAVRIPAPRDLDPLLPAESCIAAGNGVLEVLAQGEQRCCAGLTGSAAASVRAASIWRAQAAHSWTCASA